MPSCSIAQLNIILLHTYAVQVVPSVISCLHKMEIVVDITYVHEP